MKKHYLLFLLTLLVYNRTLAQTCADYTVQLSATIQLMPPKITLSWKPLTYASSISIYRKTLTATTWGTAISSLPASDTTYTDAALVADSAYEYWVNAPGSSISATGYIYAGINAPAIHNRGILDLIVDSTFSDSCKTSITQLMNDLSGDGWQIIRHDLARTVNDVTAHGLIKNDYTTHPNLKAVLLLGHIAVPYSGDLNPDGHPNHLGAWPADVYYANMNGYWGDIIVNDTSSSYAANKNIPGDGKWDQTILPSADELQVSRIDFFNMPAFAKTEIQLMNAYLNRDHTYKMDSLSINHRGLVDDNFGTFSGEAFASNAWRNFAPLIGKNNIQSIDFITSLNDSAYQWAYGCGGGTFTSAGGIGATTDFAANDVNAIFTMLFGSYFGDWNVQNNFLRAPLCSNVPALTSCWAGRPDWFFHHMAIGENIGYSAWITQNDNTLYQPLSFSANWIHVALMGDLSLRTDYIKPARNLIASSSANAGAHLSWTASPDPAVIGYYVYRSDTLYGNYQRLSSLLTATTFNDTVGLNGLKYYMVRPVKLQQTPSGTYYNLGIGITDTATVSYPSLVANITAIENVSLFPNPVKDRLNMILNSTSNSSVTISIINQTGQKIQTTTQQIKYGSNSFSFDVSKLPTGFYIAIITTDNSSFAAKWIKTE